ncbi:MAG: sigma-54-dependent Fis family transcriptional regulator [Deltaproteobacteria bacterium]|nr:MAG: sigma-54-dependent Fis family transcriptional regulator [Deltaproteobacteria bacterium]
MSQNETSETAARVLVVDDDAGVRTSVGGILQSHGYQVATACDAYKALLRTRTFDPHVLVVDVRMPGLDGVALMGQVREAGSTAMIVLMTGFGSVMQAVTAMRQGVFDYLTKPLSAKKLLTTVEAALRQGRARAAVALAAQPRQLSPFDRETLGPRMAKLSKAFSKVAPTRATVLITGETGVGKEVVARALHHASSAPGKPFVCVNSAALCESLLESELFGHESGAFTGAVRRRDGKFSQADGGTLFLDEIGEISPLIQVKLLRVIQERQFERLGSNNSISVDVRLVAATNRNLLDEVEAGRFRSDLFYRLNVVSLCVPPLRQRTEEIAGLVATFIRQFSRRHQTPIAGIDDAALQILHDYRWPGNVRELENAIEHAVIMASDLVLRAGDLPASILRENVVRVANFEAEIPGARLAEIERYAVHKTLEYVGGSTLRAATVLGISQRKIQYVIRDTVNTVALHGRP